MRRVAGFTLLEVLMAMSILALAGVAALRIASEGVGNSSYLKEKTVAHWVAENELTDLYLVGQWPGLEWRNQEREMASRTWHVRSRSVETGDDDFRAIEVEVRLDEDEDAPVLAVLRTYMVKRS